MILFKTGNDKFYYRAAGTTPVKDSASSAEEEKKTFTVKLPLTSPG